jgi:glycosyltransferase involved in cell wall biosynthesis
MRILHVIPFISAKDGGPSVAVRHMATSVHRLHGVEVEIATTDAEGTGRMNVPLGVPVEEQGVTYWHFPRQTTFYSVSLPLSAWLGQNVKRFDVVHIHGLFSYANTVAAWHAHRAGVPYIVRPFGVLHTWGLQHRRPLLKQLSVRFIEKPILKHAALVHYTSRHEQAESEAIGINTPALVAPLGVELPTEERETRATPFYQAFPQLKGKPWVLYLSRFHPKKALELLIPAFARMVHHFPDAVLVLAGDGDADYVQSLKALVETRGITANVRWVGFLKGEMKTAAFAAAPLFVLPSYSENFGIAVVEALAAETPVLISDQVAIQEEVVEWGAGTVVPCTVDAIAEGLMTLLGDEGLRSRQSEAGQRLVVQRFSIQAMADTLYTTYRHTARNHPTA